MVLIFLTKVPFKPVSIGKFVQLSLKVSQFPTGEAERGPVKGHVLIVKFIFY